MANAQLDAVIRQIRRMADVQTLATATDGQLVQRFTGGHEEAAFAVLLRRHGPMVLGLCRGVLGQLEDAEDVFQATFLVLARKAGSIRKKESVGSWLHGVAYRLAVRAKARRSLRQAQERKASAMGKSGPRVEEAWRELRPLLDEEMEKLPAQYRAALVLCYLEGKTHEETARELGCPLGTVRSRVARARQLLQQRLTRRGLALSAGSFAAFLAGGSGSAAVGTKLLDFTLKAALQFAAGKAAANIVSPPVALLVEGGLKTVLAANLRIATAVLVFGSFVTGGIGLAAHQVLAVKAIEGKQEAAKTADSPLGPSPLGGKGTGVRGKVPVAEKQTRTDRYGDPLPPGALVRIGTVRFRHGEAVRCVAFSPNGRELASASVDGTIRRWDAATGKELWRFEQNFDWGSGTCVAFSPDGKILAVRQNGPIRLWDVATGRELRRFITGMFAFSPDGKELAVDTGDRIHFYDTVTGRDLRQFRGHQAQVCSLHFSADGNTFVSGAKDGTFRIWDVATGKQRFEFRAQQGTVHCLALSADGRRLASASQDKTIRLWDIGTGKELHRWEQSAEIYSVVFSPDGKTLISGGPDETIRFWDLAAGKELRPGIRLGSCIWSLALSPDGKTLASGCQNMAIRLWDVATGKEVQPRQDLTGQIYWAAFSPDDKTMAVAALDEAIRLFDAATGKEVRRFPLDPDLRVAYTVAFSPDGKTLASAGFGSADNRVVPKGFDLWDVATGKRTQQAPDVIVYRLAFSPDGKTLAAGSGAIVLWDIVAGKELRRLLGHMDNTDALAFSPDGKVLASIDSEKTILWDVAGGKELRQLPGSGGPFGALAFSPDGKFLATTGGDVDEGGKVHLWDVARGKELRQLRRPLGSFAAVAFSPDGRMLATGDSALRADGDRQYLEYTVHLWETATGKVRRQWKGHQALIWCVAFSSDGKRLASSSFDTTVLIWEVSPQPRQQPATARDLQAWWTALAGEDAATAYQAIGSLAAAPEQCLPFLKSRLRPAVPADPERLAQLIADLDSDRFAVRDKASQELERLGESAEQSLRKALAAKPTLEVRTRLEKALQKLEAPVTSSDRLQPLRAIEVLEHIGSAEATKVLEYLSQGAPGARLTQEAKASLDRLHKLDANKP